MFLKNHSAYKDRKWLGQDQKGVHKGQLGVSTTVASNNNGSLDRRHRVERAEDSLGNALGTDIDTLLLIINNKSVRRGSVKNAPYISYLPLWNLRF